MASWWQGTDAIRESLSSGVESIKKATKDIAQELADVEEEEFGDAELQYNASNGPSARLEEMYRDLEKAYNAQQKDLEELRAAYRVNQESSRTLSDDLTASQEANARLRRQHNAATEQIAKLQEERISMDGGSTSDTILKKLETEHAENDDLRKQLSSAQEELREFKKKTKTKWDEVKGRFQNQRQEVIEWRTKYEELMTSTTNTVDDASNQEKDEEINTLKAQLEAITQRNADDTLKHEEALNALKAQNQSALESVNRKLDAMKEKLTLSDSKCQELRAQNEGDTEMMQSLSSQHQEYKRLLHEQEEEMKALREEMAKKKQDALHELSSKEGSLDLKTRRILDDLTAENTRYSKQNAILKQTVNDLNAQIGAMQSDFIRFKNTVTRHLRSEVRPSVVSLEDEYAGLRSGYQEVVSKYRQMESEYAEYRGKVDGIKGQYKTEIADLEEAIKALEADCTQKESMRLEAMSGHETLKSSNLMLKREMEDLEGRMKECTEEYRLLVQRTDAEQTNWTRSLYAVLLKHGILTQSGIGNEGQSDSDIPSVSELLQRLHEYMDSAETEKAKSDELEVQNIELVVKECGVSRRDALKLLVEHENDAAATISAFKAKEESASTERASLDRERTVFQERMEEIEGHRKQMGKALEEAESRSNELKLENAALAAELKGQRDRYESLEAQYISACNEVDEVTNAKNEVEDECDRLHEAAEHHQSVLEEERLSTQEVIEAEQERADRAVAELKRLEDAHKVLEAQKEDLVKQLRSKMKSELISDQDRSSNLLSLRGEMDSVLEENGRLKVALNSMKELHQKSVAEKDGDIIELNTVINALKMELEELRALQNDYVELTAKHRTQKDRFAAKREAFDNLQIAFDALQTQSRKMKATLPQRDKKDGANPVKGDGVGKENDGERIRLQEEVKALTLKYQSTIKQLQEVRGKFTQSQKYQIRLEHETSQLRSTISKTAQKLKTMAHSDDQVDRRIIIKLLVTFFDRWYNGGDTAEVIELISKILNFDENEKQKCRVHSASNSAVSGLWGFATSWITSDTTQSPQMQSTTDSKRQSDLGSLWVEFLLNELGENDTVVDDSQTGSGSNELEHNEEKESSAELGSTSKTSSNANSSSGS